MRPALNAALLIALVAAMPISAESRYGTEVSSWASGTLTHSWDADPDVAEEVFTRRVGDTMWVCGRITLSGDGPAASLTLDVPNSEAADESKLLGTSGYVPLIAASGVTNIAGNNQYDRRIVPVWDASNDHVVLFIQNTITGQWAALGSGGAGDSGDEHQFSFGVPISGW